MRLLRKWNRSTLALTVALFVAGVGAAWAQNENETVGFRPGHTFESGAFGEDIDILNGGLGLTVPIGPRYQVDARLGYQLGLSYSSKIWDSTDYKTSVPIDHQVIHRGEGPFGIGFTMHLGRIFKDEYTSTNCAPNGCERTRWVWVSPDGTQHEFFFESGDALPPGVFRDPPTDQGEIYFAPKFTDDLSSYRISGPKNEFCSTTGGSNKCFRVEGRDGIVYTLEKYVPCESAGLPTASTYSQIRTYNMSFCGWYTTLIEDRTIVRQPGTSQPVYPQRVVVTYGTDNSNFDHAITSITDSTGRATQFHSCEWGRGHCSVTNSHTCNNDSHCPLGETCQGGGTCSTSPSTQCYDESDCPGSSPCSVPDIGTEMETRCVPGVTVASDRSSVATYAIDLPSFGNSAGALTSDTARYGFMYVYGKIRRGDWTQESTTNLTDPVLKLVRIDYPGYEHSPGTGEDLYSLYYSYLNTDPGTCDDSFDPNFSGGDHGEIACRTLPLLRKAASDSIDRIAGNACEVSGDWPRFRYDYSYYVYRSAFLSGGRATNKHCNYPTPGTCSSQGPGFDDTGQTRQIVRKRLEWSGTSSEWTYCRAVSARTNPDRVTVRDPFGNDTVYSYRASTAAAIPQAGAVDADNGLAPEWNDGANHQIDYYEGTSNSGRLVRSVVMTHDADRDNNQKRVKGNLRSPLEQTIHRDDGNRLETTSRSQWDDRHWLQETQGGTGITNARTTRRQYGGTSLQSLTVPIYNGYMPDLLMLEEVSDGSNILKRTDNQYDNSRGWLTASVSRSVPLMAGAPWSIAQYEGDVKTAYTYSPASGNVIGKTITAGPSDPGYSVTYTWSPSVGACSTLATAMGRPLSECGGYLATKTLGTAAWKSIDRDRDANTGLILKTRDSSAIWTSYQYDKLGRVMKVSPQDEDPTVIDYVSLLETTVRRGASGSDYELTKHVYDGLGRNVVIEKRPADSSKTACQTKRFDVDGSVAFASAWRYDSTCVPGEAGEAGTVTSYKGSDSGPRDPLGRVRRVFATDHGLDVTTGERMTSTEYFGNSSRVTVGGVMGRNGSFSAATEYQHDIFGRLIHVEQPSERHCSSSWTTCQNDNDCSLGGTCVTDGGTDATYTYDGLDRLTGVELTDGASPTQSRFFNFDGMGRLVWADHPESGVTVNEAYDAFGNVVRVRDAKGTIHKFVYDFAGRLKERRVVPTGGSERLVLKNTYDLAGAGRGASAGKLTTSESYDESGVVSLTEDYYYTGVGGRLSQVSQRFADWPTPLVTSYSYDVLGQVTSMTHPVESSAGHTPLTVSFEYQNGYPVRAREGAGGRVLASVTYTASGAVETLDTPGGGNTNVTFDILHRPTKIVISSPHSSSGVDYNSGTYKYDGAGNIYQRTDPVSALNPPFGSYRYDAAQRLVGSSTRQNGEEYQESYTYDAFGNMTQKYLHVGSVYETEEFEMESGGLSNRIASRQTTLGTAPGLSGDIVPFSYDPNGNLIQGGRAWKTPLVNRDVKRYEYSPLNYLLRVLQTSNSNSTVSEVDRFKYDASGNRIAKVTSEDGMTTYYVRDGSGQVLSEYRRSALESSSVQPEWSKDYVYFAGRVVSMKENLRPSSPSGLHVAAFTEELGWYVSLNWDPNPEADVVSYQVYRKIQGPGAVFSLIGSSASPDFSDPTEHPAGKTISYQLKAVDSAGYESLISATVKVLTGDTAPPSKPVLTAVAGNGHVQLSWTSTTDLFGITGYELVRRSNTSDPGIPLSTYLLTSTTFTDLSVQNGSVYYYRVRARDNSGNWGPYSCPANPPGGVCDTSAAPKDFTAPIPVQGVTTCEEGLPSIRLTWNASPSTDHVQGYRVYRNTVPAFSGGSPAPVLLGSPTDPAFTTTPPSGNAYYYSIRAIDDASNLSWWSQPVAIARDVHTSLGDGPVFADGKEGTVTLNWIDYELSVDAYDIYRRRSGVDRCYTKVARVSTTGATMLGYVDAVPANNIAYEYVVGGVIGTAFVGMSKPGIGIPLSRPTNLFECGAVTEPYDWDNAGASNSRQYSWIGVESRIYHPISATNSVDLPGYLMGYHVNFFRDSTGSSGFPDDSIMHRVRPIRETTSSHPSDVAGLTLDQFLIEAPYYVQNSNWGDRFLLGPSNYTAYPSFTMTPDYWTRACVLPKAVYKVYAQGTWLTATSDLPSYFDKTQPPLSRCGRRPANPTDTVNPPANPVSCSDPVWPLPPTNLSAVPLGPGSVTVSWDPPTGGVVIAGYKVYVIEMNEDKTALRTAVRPSVPYAVVEASTTSIVVSGINNKHPPALFKAMHYQVVSFDAMGRVSQPTGTTVLGHSGQPGEEATASPGVPRSLRTVPWTINDAAAGHVRSRAGIKLAWESSKIPNGQTLVGFRVYRSSMGDDYGCVFLTGTPSNPALPEGTSLCSTSQALDAVVTVGASSRYFHDYSVTAGVDYYYRVTQIQQSAAGTLETPIAESEQVVGRQLFYEPSVFPPPQGLMAYAPPFGSPPQDQAGIYLKWCAFEYPVSTDQGLPPKTQLSNELEYRIYRNQDITNIRWWMHHARVSWRCLEPNTRCEITSATQCTGASVWSWDNCPLISPVDCGLTGQPPCTGIVDKVIDFYPTAAEPYATQLKRNLIYRVSTSDASGQSESVPSQPDEAWPNYCDNSTDQSCGDRMDPEGKTGPLVCGDENARLITTPGQDEVAAEVLAGSSAPYRIIGQPVCLDCDGGGTNPYSPPSRFAFFHADHLGTPRVLYDGGGNLLEKHDPLPFGEERPVPGAVTSSTRVFTGHDRDSETGLDYMLARHYQSGIGRFISPDPGNDTTLDDPQSWNRNSYVGNNPIAYADPSGMSRGQWSLASSIGNQAMTAHVGDSKTGAEEATDGDRNVIHERRWLADWISRLSNPKSGFMDPTNMTRTLFQNQIVQRALIAAWGKTNLGSARNGLAEAGFSIEYANGALGIANQVDTVGGSRKHRQEHGELSGPNIMNIPTGPFTIAVAHVHGNNAGQVPSPADMGVRVPSYMLCRTGFYVTIPYENRYIPLNPSPLATRSTK